MYNVAFSSRPVRGLGIRLRYRIYDLHEQDEPCGSSRATCPARRTGSWAVVDADRGRAVRPRDGQPYGNKTKRFDAQVSYDFRDLTLEGFCGNAQLERTSREAETGEENAYGSPPSTSTSD